MVAAAGRCFCCCWLWRRSSHIPRINSLQYCLASGRDQRIFAPFRPYWTNRLSSKNWALLLEGYGYPYPSVLNILVQSMLIVRVISPE